MHQKELFLGDQLVKTKGFNSRSCNHCDFFNGLGPLLEPRNQSMGWLARKTCFTTQQFPKSGTADTVQQSSRCGVHESRSCQTCHIPRGEALRSEWEGL